MYLYFIYFCKLINKIVINQVISYWPSYEGLDGVYWLENNGHFLILIRK